jgi:hypothetical protein
MGFYLIFLIRGERAFLQGVLEKMGAHTWCFCGEFVVECVVKLVRSWSLFVG